MSDADAGFSNAALLVMDYQAAVVAMMGVAEPMIDRASNVISAARKAGLPVIYIRVAFSPGYPEINPRNRQFGPIKGSGFLLVGDPGSDIDPRVGPVEGDTTITKHRVSAFAGTELATLLEARGIDTLILMGIATSGVVLSTVRQGSDKDYDMYVVGDCCADPDPETHRCLLEKIFPAQVAVVDAEGMVGRLTASLGQ